MLCVGVSEETPILIHCQWQCRWEEPFQRYKNLNSNSTPRNIPYRNNYISSGMVRRDKVAEKAALPAVSIGVYAKTARSYEGKEQVSLSEGVRREEVEKKVIREGI